MQGFDEAIGGLGAGFPGEIRENSDGRLYQWVEGYDGLGNPVGFWSLIPAIAKAALPLVSRVAPQLLRSGAGQLLQRVLPQATRILRQVVPTQPAPAAVPMPAAPAPDSDELTGIGALYQAPDGTFYQVQGLDEDERLAEEELSRGLDEDERLAEEELSRGLDEDERLAEEELLRGLDEDERLAEEDPLRGVDGYVRENGVQGVDAFVPPEPPHTRWFMRPTQAPDMWRPPW
jgi:hypothetical protein